MAQADSNTATVALTLQGVWLHDPTDPSGTAAQYMFGTGRTEAPDQDATRLQFVGRRLPVFEFGESISDQIQAPVTVPFGTDYATQIDALLGVAESKRVWCYRDNRGRKVFGRVSMRLSDQQVGTQVDLTVDQADFDEAV